MTKGEERKEEEQIKEEEDKAEEPLPYCTTAPSAEQARAENEDEPCDDSREGE